MLVLVVLVPIVIMAVACLLERFEARAVPGTPARRTSRADLRTPAATPPLRLVPGAAGDDDDDRVATPEPTRAPAAGLRRAS